MAGIRRRVEGMAAGPAAAALQLQWRASPPLCAALWTMAIATPFIPLASTLVTGALVGTVPAILADGLHSSAGAHLEALFAGLAALQVGRSLLAYAQGLCTAALRMRMGQAVEEMLIEAASSPRGIAHLEDPSFADDVRRARGVGSISPDQTVQFIAAPVSRVIVGLGSAVILAAFHWWLPLLLLVSSVAQRRWIQRDMALRVASMDQSVQSLRRSAYTFQLATEAAAAKEVRVFGLSQWLLGRFTEEWMAGMAKPWRERRALRTPAVLATLLAVGTTAAAVALAAAAAVRGDIGLGALAVYVQVIPGVAMLGMGQDSSTFLPMGARAAQALFDLHRRCTAAGAAEAESGRRYAAGLPRHSVRFEGVSFRYPGSDRAVFDGLDLDIEAGRSLAIVGANGAGKTTLVKLLTRLYEPTGGRISVDGVALEAIDAAQWRRRISVVFQDFVHYPLPARDNVGFGALDESVDDAALQRAAMQAGAAAVVDGLPRGWDTLLSRQFDGGVDLSGGQWQRIALARALLRAQRGGVLILDEPTANLDVRAEAELFDRLLEVTRGLTTVLISHRFSSVRRADRIVVLEHGRVVEDGSHEELVCRGGVYAGMFGVQARPFLVAAHG